MDIISVIQNPTVLLIVAVWTLPWKGVALWRAARAHDQWWFIAMLILNTLGILEILYIFIFNKRKSLMKDLAFSNPEK